MAPPTVTAVRTPPNRRSHAPNTIYPQQGEMEPLTWPLMLMLSSFIVAYFNPTKMLTDGFNGKKIHTPTWTKQMQTSQVPSEVVF